ncbi:MAG: pyridoxamine 5-phosphate oxidase family protein [Microvirga sp.]|jgi:nitroimidazol reductase NimA-like FMN-containing flavoprotein (pyridoxamine 5'-phosphate oxidase superfamily)|nr:pyridoxamine 5-phosphate oxidase family protein [Microvirga sp.]MDF2970934.1 pyridoxamine 5-phosphate oxidase family protein [Microvirga sp.]
MDEEIRQKVLTLLEQHRIMTAATLRPDGWPQATTVDYASEGLSLYFLSSLNSQKAANLARDDRVSLTIDHDASDIMAICGLSMAGHARVVTDMAEAGRVMKMLVRKDPEQTSLPGSMPRPEEVRIFRVAPTVISVLDYSKGFGHSDLVSVPDAQEEVSEKVDEKSSLASDPPAWTQTTTR